MSDAYVCWRCGAQLVELILPMSRREECPDCAADQHVCKMCHDYEPGLSQGCSEERAEYVSDKEKANFCDYFSPITNAYTAKQAAGSKARAQLDELFADADTAVGAEDKSQGSATRDALDDLFAKD